MNVRKECRKELHELIKLGQAVPSRAFDYVDRESETLFENGASVSDIVDMALLS